MAGTPIGTKELIADLIRVVGRLQSVKGPDPISGAREGDQDRFSFPEEKFDIVFNRTKNTMEFIATQ